jgi:translocation and assembly module TamA
MPRFASPYVAVACLVLLLSAPVPLFAADPVELEVTGVEGDARKNVRDALALPYGLVRDGKVDRLWLDRFAKQAGEKARVALQPFGFYNAQVSATVHDVEPGAYRLLVAVLPGPPVRVAEVDLELQGPGSGEAELRQLARSFPVKRGGVLLQPEYERAKGGLKSRAVALGYLDADFSRHQLRIAPGATSARVLLTFQTGPRYSFDGVRIEGAPDYPQEYLRRFLAFKEGEPFSYAKLGETQLNYANSERFKEVVVTPEKEKASELRIPVLVKLTAAPRRTLRPGVGYGTDTGPRFSVRFRDLNLLHEGQDLDLSLYLAQRLQGFAGRYIIPSATDIKSSTSLQLNLQQEDITTYVSRLVALELARNHSFGKGELGTAYVKLQREIFTVGGDSSTSTLVLPGYRFSKENYDDLVRPSRAYRYSLDLRGTHPLLASDSALVQFIAEGHALLPLPWRLSFQTRGKFGATLMDDPLADIPPSIRFFAGGDQSVRGYSYQGLGPRNAAGKVVGGRNLLVGSLELERALFEDWGVSIFHDAGNAFNDFNQKAPDLFQAVGVGAHYYTPVGGLNLYLARPLDGSRSFRIHFTVGFQL